MLKAYGEAPSKLKGIIYNLASDANREPQIVDDTRPDVDAYLAEASPLIGRVMRQNNISYTHVGTRAIYALNVLNKVTDAMLPSEMPPAPKNRKEPARRRTPRG